MGNVVSNVIGAITLVFAYILSSSKLLNKHVDFKNLKLYIYVVVISIFMLLNYFYGNPFIRILVISIIFMICSKLVFNEKFNKIVISTLFIEIMINAFDLLLALVLIYIFKLDVNNFFGTIIANIFVSIFIVVFFNFKFAYNFNSKVVNFTEKVKKQKLIMLSLITIISFNILLAVFYYKINVMLQLIINIILLLIYSYIIIKNIETSNNNSIIKAENILLMENLHQYEDMVDRQRVDNHENKNQLLIIKNMINKKDKDVVKYIDTIVKDQKEDDEALYTKVKTIPSGGLQGIIYQKMLVMKDEKILFSLDVSRDVRKVDLDNFSMEDNYRLCKIIGVFLDNAIEESKNIDDKRIMISLYVDDGNFIIDISNKFNGKIELDKLDDEGYTTKSDGHGYGLSLVKKILSETDKFENERSIRKDIFKQIIKVKIKNT